MNIKELQKTPTLSATPKMMLLAANDMPRKEKIYGWERVVYDYGLYMRCQVHNDILYVAFYLTEHMRSGGKNPAYELFVDHTRKQFITYDKLHDRWQTSKLDRLDWPRYVLYPERTWITRADSIVIKKYLNTKNDGYDGLLEYQRGIRAEELKRRHKRETNPWDADLAQIPELPKDWGRWVSKVGIQENYIFYRYCRKGADTGYCSYCEKDVPVKQPRHNKQGRCPVCRHEITFKSIGKAGTVVTSDAVMNLIQRCTDGFVIRRFTGYRKYPKGEYASPQYSYTETRRTLYNESAQVLRAYYWGDYKNCEIRWMPSGLYTTSSYGGVEGMVYGKTLPSLAKKELSRTGLIEMLSVGSVDLEKYLAVHNANPLLEKLVKAQLMGLARECIGDYYNFKHKVFNAEASSLTKILGINTQELKRLRLNNGGWRFLAWIRYEKAIGRITPDRIITWFCGEGIKPEDLKFIAAKMSAVQVHNYLRRQMSTDRMTSREVLTTWADYLSMAKRLKMDTSDEIIFRVSMLRQRHDELVERCHEKDLAIRAGEVLEQYPHVDDICQSLKDKYEHSNDTYSIVAPTCIEDIMLEGRNLHHCISNSDRYWERIERRETYILFLRRTQETDKSYYTLEIEPNGTVRQKRTMYDRQEADIEDASKFLAEWQKVISKRLTEEDRRLGEVSRSMRLIQYEQLQKDRVIINTGALAGHLLVDVLLADLMENSECLQTVTA